MLGLDYSSSDEDSCAVNHDGEERREEVCSDVVRCKQDNATVPSSPALEQREEMEEEQASSPLNGLPVSKSKDRSTNVFYSAEKVNSETLAKCKQYLDIPNFDLTESIRNKKEFGNPHILDVVVDHFKIDEVSFLAHLCFFRLLIYSNHSITSRLGQIIPKIYLIHMGIVNVTTRMVFVGFILKHNKWWPLVVLASIYFLEFPVAIRSDLQTHFNQTFQQSLLLVLFQAH